MSQIIWAPEAFDDLMAIFDYVADDSLYYAEKLVDDISNRVQILIEQPKSGRRVPEKNDEHCREVFEGKYRIIYSTHNSPIIEVLRIIHFSRSFNM